MDNSYSDSYREAGVDVTAGYKAVELMKNMWLARRHRASFPVSAVLAACFSLT